MSKTTPNVSKISKEKFDKYCQETFGRSFREAIDRHIHSTTKDFVDNIKQHIESAEKEFGQNYLEIKR